MRNINTFRINNNAARRNPIDVNKHKNVKNFLLYWKFNNNWNKVYFIRFLPPPHSPASRNKYLCHIFSNFFISFLAPHLYLFHVFDFCNYIFCIIFVKSNMRGDKEIIDNIDDETTAFVAEYYYRIDSRLYLLFSS